MKFLPLSQSPLSTRVLITSFLITLALGNVAAGVYTQKYVGISYESLVETYSERDRGPIMQHSHGDEGKHLHAMGAGAEYGEVPISLEDIREMPHKVDLKLLLQDTHVHIFSHGVLNLLLGCLILLTQIQEKWKVILIPLPFLGGVLDFGGMFLVKYVADGFAYLIIFAGALSGICFIIVFFLLLYEMWILPFRHRT